MPEPSTPDFDRWASELVADEERARRTREAWLVRQAEQEATLQGTLVDFAERRDPVVVTLRNGRRHHGVLRLVGRELVGLQTPTGLTVLAPSHSIAWVGAGGRARCSQLDNTGDRIVRTAGSLHAALETVAERQCEALIDFAGAVAAMRGVIESVGTDVLRVRVDGSSGAAHVPIAAIAAIVVHADLFAG
ncbi:MAG: hypothetical protein N2037_01015 [Acidimicrobiales bacterium]|nr:hypothetical protein [Acidimicrobiales bacterium]